MGTQKIYLVFRADGSARVARRPRIQADEVAIGVNLRFPEGWGRVIQTIDVDVPDFAPVVESVDEPEESAEGEEG